MREGGGKVKEIPIVDTHCDGLWKMQQIRKKSTDQMFSFDHINENELTTTITRLQAGNVKIQFFAIFISPDIPYDLKWHAALEQIELFYREILAKNKTVKHIRQWRDIDRLQGDEIGAVLALEGAEAFGDDLSKLNYLYQLGVRSIGLTWNEANLCADGIGEERGAGLTRLGKEVVRLNNLHEIFTDVSHASIKAFWDIIEYADYPIASHSNAKEICDHPRNLADEQIKAMFANNGLIHLVFYPPFIKKESKTASISDLIKHIDHLSALGGVNQIGFGSDFDGIDSTMTGVEHAGQYSNIINELLKYYREEEVKGFAYQNFLNHLPNKLKNHH